MPGCDPLDAAACQALPEAMWYYKINDSIVGPLPQDALRRLKAEGSLPFDALVRQANAPAEAWLSYQEAFPNELSPGSPEENGKQPCEPLFIECFRGPDAGKRARLHPGQPLTIGRMPEAAVLSEDKDLPEEGFEIKQEDAEVVFRSLGDSSGYLDGVAKSSGALPPEAQLRLGSSYWRLKDPASISNSSDSAAQKGILDSLSSNVTRLVGVEEIQGFSLRRLFSQVFTKHSQEEVEEKFICGTRTTSPELMSVNTGWPEPWLFVRMLAGSVALCAVFFYGLYRFENPILFTGLLFSAALAVPVSAMVLFWEMHAVRNVSLYQIVKLSVVGGVLAIFISLFFFEQTGLDRWLAASSAGIIEEAGKVCAVVILMHRYARYQWILNGMLFGAAVGTGFAALETAGYLLVYLDDFLTVAIVRGMLSPFSHIVWTAATAAALWKVKGSLPFSWGMLKDSRFLKVFIAAVILHALWNAPFGIPFLGDTAGLIAKWISLGIVGWIILLALLQEGLKEVRAAQEAEAKAMPVEPAPAESMNGQVLLPTER